MRRPYAATVIVRGFVSSYCGCRGRTCDEDAEGEGGDDNAAGSVVERALKRIIQN